MGAYHSRYGISFIGLGKAKYLFNLPGHLAAVRCVWFVWIVREELKELSKDFDHSEDDLKSLQSGVGQIVGEVLRQLTEDKCKYVSVYVWDVDVSVLNVPSHCLPAPCSHCESL